MKAAAYFVFLILFIFNRPLLASDHLEPEAGIFSGDGNVVYELAIHKYLLSDTYRKIQMLSVPSFRSEEVVYLLEGGVSSEVIFKRISGRGIWSSLTDELSKGSKNGGYNTDKESMEKALRKLKIKIEKHSASISMETLKLLESVWERVLQNVKYPIASTVGLDGVTYHFYNWKKGIGFKAGRVWSPLEKSLMYDLVKLGEKLGEYAKANDSARPAIEIKIKEQASNLLKRIK